MHSNFNSYFKSGGNIPSQPELQTCWRERCTGQRWSPPSAQSACTAAEAQLSRQHAPFKRRDTAAFQLFCFTCVGLARGSSLTR